MFGVLVLLVALLSACGGSASTEQTAEPVSSTVGSSAASTEEEAPAKEGQSIEVDKGVFNVEVTLPASLVEGQDIDLVISEAKEKGVKEVIKNDDGSLTYKMSKAVHSKILKEMEDEVLKTVEEMKSSGDFKSIKDVTHNKTFSEFTLVVDRAAYENSFDGFAALGLGMSGMFYQLFIGASPDDNKVTINIKNADTGEVFDTVVYPDALEEQ